MGRLRNAAPGIARNSLDLAAAGTPPDLVVARLTGVDDPVVIRQQRRRLMGGSTNPTL
ncbi:MAG: hypothetical protein OXI76_12570 [Gemmatimonadota bacterium]|nr:hypothetical protein [Gemmatimonadota bacterium]